MNRKEYQALLKKAGFKIYAIDAKTDWFKFEKDGKIGYCEFHKYDGFNFSTVHKPNHETGTGFSIYREVSTPTIQHALDCFVLAPIWATSRDIQSVKKYKNMEEYLKEETTLKYKQL